MQMHQPNMGQIESAGNVVGNQAATSPAMHPGHFLSSSQDEVLALLKPGGDRKRTVILVGSALLVGLGLGWAGAANISLFNSIPQAETPSRRLPEIKSSGKSDGARKMASTSAVQTPSAASAVSLAAPASPASAAQANTALAAREPMVPVAETRPTTIEGWTVLEVRGGTVVLEGPDGVRTAVRGDTVPGIGRIDSIVRWGNRWIVATASGLIANP